MTRPDLAWNGAEVGQVAGGLTDDVPGSHKVLCRQASLEVRQMHDDDLDIESDLVDLHELDLELLPSIDDSVLAEAIRRVLRAAEDPDEATQGFQQSL